MGGPGSGRNALKAGEIRLIETTPGKAEAAKARLDAHRKKRRERHAKKETAPLNRPSIMI